LLGGHTGNDEDLQNLFHELEYCLEISETAQRYMDALYIRRPFGLSIYEMDIEEFRPEVSFTVLVSSSGAKYAETTFTWDEEPSTNILTKLAISTI
jgi:hypothetical protein